MRVSEYYTLGLTQPSLDFVDVELLGDTPLYLDPQALLVVGSEWADSCITLIQDFFGEVLRSIHEGDNARAQSMLRRLTEPNETHLGQSTGRRSRGRGLGKTSSLKVFDALSASQAARSGLLEDLEDTILVIPHIDKDMVSDITTDILRGPLLAYTQDTCEFYGIPTYDVDSGPVWDPQASKWINFYTKMPVPTSAGKLLLVPKSIVRQRQNYDSGEYYQHFILNFLQDIELAAGSSLVEVLKDGRERVTKEAVKEKYGDTKQDIAAITSQYPEILERYRTSKRANRPGPLTHAELAHAAGFVEPDFDDLLSKVKAVDPGKAGANQYHLAVDALLSALFYPALSNPIRESNIHEGRKRIDIRYDNTAKEGFFNWVSLHYASPYLWVECKNYKQELGNKEYDQLSGRFSPQRGKVGFLLYRGFGDKDDVWQHCLDTARDDRGWMIPLDDEDLTVLVEERKTNLMNTTFAELKSRFDRLVN